MKYGILILLVVVLGFWVKIQRVDNENLEEKIARVEKKLQNANAKIKECRGANVFLKEDMKKISFFAKDEKNRLLGLIREASKRVKTKTIIKKGKCSVESLDDNSSLVLSFNKL